MIKPPPSDDDRNSGSVIVHPSLVCLLYSLRHRFQCYPLKAWIPVSHTGYRGGGMSESMSDSGLFINRYHMSAYGRMEWIYVRFHVLSRHESRHAVAIDPQLVA